MVPSRPPDHIDDSRFLRYHVDVHFPREVAQAAAEFLPPPGQSLPLSAHYKRIQPVRNLPIGVSMPNHWQVIEATVTKETGVVYRVLIRFVWNKRSDLAVVLEGDWEMVTAYWQSPNDFHYDTLDRSQYVQEGED